MKAILTRRDTMDQTTFDGFLRFTIDRDGLRGITQNNETVQLASLWFENGEPTYLIGRERRVPYDSIVVESQLWEARVLNSTKEGVIDG